MRVYLAGAGSALRVALEDYMHLFLAGSYSRPYVIGQPVSEELTSPHRPYILESFFYIRKMHDFMEQKLPHLGAFLLDSGAFTFLNNKKGAAPNWEKYTEEYAAFINRHRIKLFFELDIDPLVGLPEVERLRAKLETLTGLQCIPVWHKSRGLDYWRRMVTEYSYVAIGGIVTKEIKPAEYGIFTALLRIAKDASCKVHGLGFTSLEGVKKYPFHSVDSTAWTYGNRAGFIYRFTGTTLTKISPKGKMLTDNGKAAAIHNFAEWVKFQQYADANL